MSRDPTNFLFLLGEYGVPHACALQVFATELLGWASTSNWSIDVVWPALPNTVITAVALLVVLVFWHRCAVVQPTDVGDLHPL